jgi:hypothetical protein
MQIPYKLNISSWKMIKILNHHQKNKFSHTLVLLYFKLELFFINNVHLNPLYVVKYFWNFEILNNFETFFEFF